MATPDWHNVALVRERMQARGLTPAAIGGIDDIAALPFTVKADLRDTYPFGLFASPMDEVVRLHASWGPAGKPIVVAYTQEDHDVWTEAMARTFAAATPWSRKLWRALSEATRIRVASSYSAR